MISVLSSLFRRPEKFTNVDELSPAAKAQAVWDEREGGLVVQNYNLRRLLYLGAGLCTVLVGGIVYIATRSSIIPYVVELDTNTGEVRNLGTVAASANYHPNVNVEKFFISKFLKCVREVPTDRVVYNEHLMTAFNFSTKDCAVQIKAILDADSATFGEDTVQLEITNLLPLDETTTETSKSWQIRWREDRINHNTGNRTVTPYSGIISTRYIQTTDEEQLKVNPLGLYIYSFTMSKDATAINNTQQSNIQDNRKK